MSRSPITVSSRRLLQNHDTLVVWMQRLLNAVVVIAVLFALSEAQEGEFGTQYRYMAIVAVLLMLVVYQYTGVYRRFAGLFDGVQQLARAWGIVVMVLGIVAFVTKTSEDYSRQIILLWVVSAFLLQAALYVFAFLFFRNLQSRSKRIDTLIVGSGALARHLALSIMRNPWLPDTVRGVLCESTPDIEHWNVADVPVLGTFDQLEEIVSGQRIRRVYLALPLALTARVEEMQRELFELNVDIVWAPDIFSLDLLNHSVREVAGVPLISLSESPLIAGGRAFLKTATDKILGLLALLAFSPLMLAVAAAIRLTSRGPVIFRQLRHGWDGRIIEVYKFRSMYVEEKASTEVVQASRHDPRVTPVGRFIRRTSIDELPQLFNVIQGSMSLVGPRPHAIAHNVYYSDKVNIYFARHRIKPGMTGLAQIMGCRGETDTLEKMQDRVKYDLEYINNWSPWLDMKILMLTPARLFSRNAY